MNFTLYHNNALSLSILLLHDTKLRARVFGSCAGRCRARFRLKAGQAHAYYIINAAFVQRASEREDPLLIHTSHNVQHYTYLWYNTGTVRMYVCMHVCMYVLYVCMCVCQMYVCCMCVCMYVPCVVCMYVCMHVFMMYVV